VFSLVGRVTPCAPSLLNPTAAAAGHSDDKSIPSPPLVGTILSELDSSGCSWSSLPVRDGHATGDPKKIALPIDTVFCSDKLLPVLERRLHSAFARKRNNRVQMIRQKQAHTAMPKESLTIKFDRGQHSIASVCSAQLVLARQDAVNGDKEPTALGYPLRGCVRQFLRTGKSTREA
jgi:hypothetical protein